MLSSPVLFRGSSLVKGPPLKLSYSHMISSGQKNAGESDDLHFQVWPTSPRRPLACFFSLHADKSGEENPVENLKIESDRATR